MFHNAWHKRSIIDQSREQLWAALEYNDHATDRGKKINLNANLGYVNPEPCKDLLPPLLDPISANPFPQFLKLLLIGEEFSGFPPSKLFFSERSPDPPHQSFFPPFPFSPPFFFSPLETL
ncbi:hypothetical protein VNO77_27328 [Canavalia gladiata]|uniref:Uncharacterized protein n=1 Tax=Canavalia gladiata TaxID=3824 RepID=A0AAN9KUH4_CANGL